MEGMEIMEIMEIMERTEISELVILCVACVQVSVLQQIGEGRATVSLGEPLTATRATKNI